MAFPNKSCNSLEGVVISVRQATVLCPNSIPLVYVYACSLYDLASYNQQYNEVVTKCSRALKISSPNPKRNYYIFKDLSQEWETKTIKRKLMQLIKLCERRKNWVVVISGLTIEEYQEEENDI